jgi:hypothetical protein
MHPSLQESIYRQRTSLYNMLVDPLARAAKGCASVWNDREQVNQVLLEALQSLP